MWLKTRLSNLIYARASCEAAASRGHCYYYSSKGGVQVKDKCFTHYITLLETWDNVTVIYNKVLVVFRHFNTEFLQYYICNHANVKMV